MSEHEYAGHPISFGAGVNSTALAIMLVQEGWRGPIVFSDTGTEWPETMAYLEGFRGWLAPYGLDVTVVDGAYRRGKTALPLIEYCEYYRLTPLPARRWCTSRWKVEPLQRWCRANGLAFEDMLVGIAADEARRQPDRIRPLVERRIDRDGCIDVIHAAGLDTPPKSGCWICPFQREAQWRQLYLHHPDLFERAARLEEAATARRADGHITHQRRSRDVTLRQLEASFRAQLPLFPTQEEGQ